MSMPVDIERAIAYVRERATPVEAARLRLLLTREAPSAETMTVVADQRADGGWAPRWASDYSSLDATCFRLAQAEQSGADPSAEAIGRALAFLVRRQRSDGNWGEDEAVAASAPPWAAPGDLAARLYLTANCAFWLALWGAEGLQRSAAERGADALAAHLREDGTLPSFAHTQWLAVGTLLRLGRDEEAIRMLDGLARRLAEGSPPEALSWMLVTLLLAELPATHPVIARGVTLLTEAQRPDGSWASEDGPVRDVHVTLEALHVQRLVGWW